MQLRTRIAAGAALATVAVMAGVFILPSSDRRDVGARQTSPSSATKPIAADPTVVDAGRNARMDAFFASLERQPPTASLYLAMKTEFPQRYAEMKDTLRKEMEGSHSFQPSSERMIALTRESLDGVQDLIRQSSDESLRKVAAAQYALLSILSVRNPAVCARYAAEGGYADMPQDAAVLEAVTGLSTVQVHAAGDAARSPRKRKPPTPAVFMQLVQKMRTDGITDQQIYLLGDGKLGTLPPEEQCRVAMSMYRSTLTMPAVDAGTLLAAIIKT